MGEAAAKWTVRMIIVLGIVITFWLNPHTVQFWEFKQEDIVRLFTQLILVALIIERALEVLLTPWRAPDSGRIAKEIEFQEQATRGAEQQTPEAVEQAKKTLHAKKVELVGFKSQTQRIAFEASLAVGVIVSLLGIRAFAPLVEPNAFEKLPELQQSAFNAMDVLLTGALLSGGADGLHKILSLFLEYVDATRTQVQAKAKP